MMCSPPASTTASWSTLGARLRLVERRVVRRRVDLGRVEALLVQDLGREARRVAAELDVRAAAGHVGGDRDGARRPGLGDDRASRSCCFALSVSCLMPRRLSSVDEHLATSRPRPCRPAPAARRRHLLDLVDQRVELARLVLVDEVGQVLADHRPVGRDRHDLEVVDLVELLGLGHRRAGHAGQLVVQAEVVLERDRGQGPALALDAQALLRLDRLVQALAPAAAGHLAAGELVDDDDLAVLDDVVPVALVQRVRLQRRVEVAREPRVGVVQVRRCPSSFSILSTPSSVGETALSLRSTK